MSSCFSSILHRSINESSPNSVNFQLALSGMKFNRYKSIIRCIWRDVSASGGFLKNKHNLHHYVVGICKLFTLLDLYVQLLSSYCRMLNLDGLLCKGLGTSNFMCSKIATSLASPIEKPGAVCTIMPDKA